MKNYWAKTLLLVAGFVALTFLTMGCQSRKRVTEGREVPAGYYQIPENNMGAK
jgi:hypothetical protein